jgi:iron complex transport system ATP-binding protein
MMIALAAQNLHVSLGNVPVLHGVDVAFQRGCWTAVVGPNGAGKSTLLKALAGLIPVNGHVQLLGNDLPALSSKQKARQLAWLGQTGYSGSDGLSVYDTVMLGRLPYQGWLAAPSQTDHQAVKQALNDTQSWGWRKRTLNALSGGERQRVLLARVLAVQAAVVLMDEPLVNVDPPHQADWVGIVRELVAKGTTVITVLHELNVALAADRLLMMKDGRITHHGPCSDVVTHRAIEALFNHRIQVQLFDNNVFATLKLSKDA